MLVDMHAHVIPGSLEAVGSSPDHRGPRIAPCDDPHARLLENDRVLERGGAARHARVHPRDAGRLRRAAPFRTDSDCGVRRGRGRTARLRRDHHQRARRASPPAAPGLQPRRRRLPDGAPARAVLLGSDVERGAAGLRGRGPIRGPRWSEDEPTASSEPGITCACMSTSMGCTHSQLRCLPNRTSTSTCQRGDPYSARRSGAK